MERAQVLCLGEFYMPLEAAFFDGPEKHVQYLNQRNQASSMAIQQEFRGADEWLLCTSMATSFVYAFVFSFFSTYKYIFFPPCFDSSDMFYKYTVLFDTVCLYIHVTLCVYV